MHAFAHQDLWLVKLDTPTWAIPCYLFEFDISFLSPYPINLIALLFYSVIGTNFSTKESFLVHSMYIEY